MSTSDERTGVDGLDEKDGTFDAEFRRLILVEIRDEQWK